MKGLIVVNYIMVVKQLLSIPIYWNGDHFVGKADIQNIFTRTRYQVVIQKNHFVDNTKQHKTNKGHKIRIPDHLNESF